MNAPEATLQLAQDYIRAVEGKELEAVARTLAANAQQLFMHTKRTKTPEGVADILSGKNRKALCVADLVGRDEVLAYTQGLMKKFTPLVWRDTTWSASPDGKRALFSGKGDMVVARSGKPYRNNYVTIFEVKEGKIVRMIEYADAFLYARLGICPNKAEVRSLFRALKHLLPFRSRSAG